jgi:hypothetical protein
MRTYALAIAAAAALFASAPAAFSQEIELGPGGVRVQPFPHYQGRSVWRGRRCEELRRACVYKEELGEQGQGNCRRYRQYCGRYE